VVTKQYPSERAAALIREGIDILRRDQDAPDGADLKRITFELGGVLKEEGAAVAMTFEAIYRETEAEAKVQGPGSEAARRLPLIQGLVAVASKTGSRSRRQKSAQRAAPKPPQLLYELTAIKILDAPPAKVERGAPSLRIGDPGPMGRILIRGEAGHDIIPELYPLDSEIVIDKPGKGAFYATELSDVLQKYGIENLLVCGVTTEVCVNTTVREANDRGYRCVVLSDGCASYFPEFHEMGLKMIKAQGGIFGWVSDSAAVLKAMASETSHTLAAGASR